MIKNDYPRNMIGYGRRAPAIWWPEKARIAVQFVVNYEEGGENCVLHGDECSESFLSDIAAAVPIKGQRNMNMESMYEYGSRVGFWRLYNMLQNKNIPVTVFGVATALSRNPEAVEAMQEANWEIACHGLKWIDYQNVPIERERADMAKAVQLQSKITGSAPKGWYTGRVSPNTRSLVLENGAFTYDSDSYNDDLPYWVGSTGESDAQRSHLIIPYSLDSNDMRFTTSPGFDHGETFYQYLRDTFDVLYAEGNSRPKMMSIGLHPRIIGRPGRLAGLVRFIDHIKSSEKVWICRRDEIAEHWYREFKELSPG